MTANAAPAATQDTILNAELSANYRPGQRKVRERKSVDHTIRHGVRSILRSVVKRNDFDVPDLAALAQLQLELDAAMRVAIVNLRDQGHSWQALADALGVTRQAMHKRFALELR